MIHENIIHFCNLRVLKCLWLLLYQEVAVGERIAYWIRTPQVPGSRPGWYGTFYWASDCWPPWQHQVQRSLVCVEGRGRISRSGLTQDIKMGSLCIPVWHSTSMDSTETGWPRVCILWRGGVSCPVSAAWHFCVTAHWSKYHCYKQALSQYDLRCFKATLNPKQTKQTSCYITFHFQNPNQDWLIHQSAFRHLRQWKTTEIRDWVLLRLIPGDL